MKRYTVLLRIWTESTDEWLKTIATPGFTNHPRLRDIFDTLLTIHLIQDHGKHKELTVNHFIQKCKSESISSGFLILLKSWNLVTTRSLTFSIKNNALRISDYCLSINTQCSCFWTVTKKSNESNQILLSFLFPFFFVFPPLSLFLLVNFPVPHQTLISLHSSARALGRFGSFLWSRAAFLSESIRARESQTRNAESALFF